MDKLTFKDSWSLIVFSSMTLVVCKRGMLSVIGKTVFYCKRVLYGLNKSVPYWMASGINLIVLQFLLQFKVLKTL